MTVMRKVGVALLVALMAAGLSGCSYNTFVGQEEAIKTQWAQVENQLQRRNDLIPNLVETTKGIAQQEKDVFGQIADSRAKLAGAQDAGADDRGGQRAERRARAAAGGRRELSAAAVERAVRPADGRTRPARRTASPSSGCATTSASRSTTRRGGRSRRTSRRASSGSRNIPLFNAPPEAERVPRVDFGNARRRSSHAASSMPCCRSSTTR